MSERRKTDILNSIIVVIFTWTLGLILIILYYGINVTFTIIGFLFMGLGVLFIYKSIESVIASKTSLVGVSKDSNIPHDRNLVKTNQVDEIDYTITTQTIGQKRY